MKEKRDLLWGGCLLSGFALWTVLIRIADVRAVGPEGSSVGFAAFNTWFHRLTGVHMTLYTITDWLGLVPIFICLCFAGLGLAQLIRRRSLLKVDADILLLGGYYLLVIGCYLFFEMVPLNYRPILIDGFLEASYPSSTTLLTLSVTLSLVFQMKRRCRNTTLRRVIDWLAMGFCAFMVLGRLISGVHWATDIIGSVLLSFGLFGMYRAAVGFADRRKDKKWNST